jgi:hypothetical protein
MEPVSPAARWQTRSARVGGGASLKAPAANPGERYVGKALLGQVERHVTAGEPAAAGPRRAELGTQRQGPFDITLEGVAEPQLDGSVTSGDLVARLLRHPGVDVSRS